MRPTYTVCVNYFSAGVSFFDPKTIDEAVVMIVSGWRQVHYDYLRPTVPLTKPIGCVFVLEVFAGQVRFVEATDFIESVVEGQIREELADQGLKHHDDYPEYLTLRFRSPLQRKIFAGELDRSAVWTPHWRHLLKDHGEEGDDIELASVIDIDIART